MSGSLHIRNIGIISSRQADEYDFHMSFVVGKDAVQKA